MKNPIKNKKVVKKPTNSSDKTKPDKDADKTGTDTNSDKTQPIQ